MTPGKRIFDILLALGLSIALLPVMLAIAALILLRDGRPVFFVSDRMKTAQKSFRLWKFRTMAPSAGDGGVSGGHKAGQVTRIGQILRRTRMDEIPQLWNVLKGDISFVGPRPPLPSVVARFPELYAQVLQSRPGITGLATLYFHRHEEWLMAACGTPEEARAVYDRRVVARKARLDLIYQRRRSMAMDLRLIGMTAARAAGWM
ncbi:MAG: sugar transferase [Rhodobacter sp.]|nr:sugar transferase [Rhodobacter sp.]